MKKIFVLLFLTLAFNQLVFLGKAHSQTRSPGEITVWVGAADREIIADVHLSLYSYPDRKNLLGTASQKTGLDGKTTFQAKQIVKSPPTNAVLEMEIIASPKVKAKASISVDLNEGAYLVVRISKDNRVLSFSKEESLFAPPATTPSSPIQKKGEFFLWLLAAFFTVSGFGIFFLLKKARKT